MTRCLPAAILASALAAPLPAAALTVFFGADGELETLNSESAFADWSAQVGTFTLDTLDGLSGFPPTSTAGNSFSRNFAGFQNPAPGVLDRVFLSVFGTSPFTWTPPAPVIAFGFFGLDLEGGDLVVSFDDGTPRTETRTTVGPNRDSFFFGVSDLSGPVSSVTITPGDNTSEWDRFVYVTAPPEVIPVPPAAALLLGGLGALGFFRRRTA